MSGPLLTPADGGKKGWRSPSLTLSTRASFQHQQGGAGALYVCGTRDTTQIENYYDSITYITKILKT